MAKPGAVTRWAAAALAAALLAGCQGPGSDSTGSHSTSGDPRLLAAASEPQNWLTHGGTYDEQRFSRLDRINDGNVGQLGLAWSFELDTNRGQETTPLVVDGKIYLTTAWSKVVALDGATGAKLWQYDPQVPGAVAVRGCCDVVNRGAAYADRRIFVGTFDGRLVALDAANGKQLWSVNTVDSSKPYTITGAPRVVKNLVVIGNGGAEYGVRGYVSAYDIDSGRLVWRFYTIPGDPAKGPDGAASDDVLAKVRDTWSGEWYRYGGGGTVWDAIVYDRELDQIYIGVGNGTPWNHRIRSAGKGDNLFLASIVALDPDTGKYIWHYQENPAESWDFTATQPMILADLTIEGKQVKALMQAPKNGFFYVLDRRNGKLVSAKNFVPVNWAKGIDLTTGRPIENPEARYADKPFVMSPSSYGAHNWYPMSYNPKSGLVYFPAQQIPIPYQNEEGFRFRPGFFNLGSLSDKNGVPDDPAIRKAIRASLKGSLVAWDPVKQSAAWQVDLGGPGNGGTVTTAGNLVFQGTQSGYFNAFSADRGKKLWSFRAHTAIIGSPISYAIGAEQYVLVVSGAGGSFGLTSPFVDDKHRKPNGRVLAFKLNGQARLPPYTPAPLTPANPSPDAFSAAQLTRGEHLYETTCTWCHGPGGISSGVVPDLRRSGVLTDRDVWKQVVIDGILKDQGMVSFSALLSPADAEAIRGYVSERAKVLKTQEAKSGS